MLVVNTFINNKNKSKMEKKKNSIEWLVEQLLSQHGIDITRLAVTDKAKAMHKEEILQTFEKGYVCGYRDNGDGGIDYYNETFGGQDNE